MSNKEESKVELSENDIIALRRDKLTEMREKGVAFPNHFRRDSFALELKNKYESKSAESLEAGAHKVKIAGRIMLRRLMGKASFITIQDVTGRVQAYVRKDNLPEGHYDEFKSWDIGDIVGVEGVLFKTKTGELSVKASDIQLLTKSLRPLPDKHHGLSDTEKRYRQRYLDLIMNEEVRENFKIRSNLIVALRHFLREKGFFEVETPMMQTIPGGAVARPFITHHNALDMQLYLRIAPELFLKRLVVGGFEKVFEINRNFRNEGISTRHNPEFTMVEFYQAYADYKDLMDLTEEMLPFLAKETLGTTKLHYQGHDFDLAKPFQRMTVKEAILHFNSDISEIEITNLESAKKIAERLGIKIKESYGLGKVQIEIFEATAEEKLIEPTFITEYPTEVSPLARKNDENPFITDRFELFIAGRELANGFSELNDAEDQAERFKQQVAEKEGGDLEAMHYDADYVTALEYGMPPTAGEGIGIDRLVMLFTDAPSIRDVLLFPHMKHQGS